MTEDLYPQMLCRIQPWPEPVTRSFRLMNEKIYEQMQGKSEFLVTGNLKNWERWDQLHEIKTRALTIGAKYDEMDPGRHGENGKDDAERHQLPLSEWKSSMHVGRPASILPRFDSASEIVVNQRWVRRALVISRLPCRTDSILTSNASYSDVRTQ